ncbi:hypothetical protein Dsin_005921 [Dipteronia sinensis]|uniref:Uncharacterized protein n=1 Tax=Dipteronia sinensis TaxID=43782 RepID=A0AAE0EFC9_9ROSI|nr:hypothetical protein Dsin_005921 [Dipteronia sinensis]
MKFPIFKSETKPQKYLGISRTNVHWSALVKGTAKSSPEDLGTYLPLFVNRDTEPKVHPADLETQYSLVHNSEATRKNALEVNPENLTPYLPLVCTSEGTVKVLPVLLQRISRISLRCSPPANYVLRTYPYSMTSAVPYLFLLEASYCCFPFWTGERCLVDRSRIGTAVPGYQAKGDHRRTTKAIETLGDTGQCPPRFRRLHGCDPHSEYR